MINPQRSSLQTSPETNPPAARYGKRKSIAPGRSSHVVEFTKVLDLPPFMSGVVAGHERSAVSNMTARLSAGSIVAALMLSASLSSAGPVAGNAVVLFGAASLGQNAPDLNAGSKQAQSDDFLRRARQAMAENDYAAAERLISQAEALGVDYGPFCFGDTPKKAMRDLEQRRAQANATPPSQMFSPQSARRPVDPFAARTDMANGNPAAAPGPAVTRLPSVDPAAQVQGLPPDNAVNPFGRATASMTPPTDMDDRVPAALRSRMPVANDAAGQMVMSNQILLAARQALALGDVHRAGLLLEQAKAIQVMRGPSDDNPQNVEQLVRKCAELNAVPADRKASEGFRLAYARLLVEQAEGLLRRGDLDESERLATESSRQRVIFGALETRPEMLLQRIAAIRHQGGAPAATAGMTPGYPGAVVPAGGQFAASADQRASLAVYDAAHDPTHNVPASAVQPVAPPSMQQSFLAASQSDPSTPAAPAPAAAPATMPNAGDANPGMEFYLRGEAALRARDVETAMQCFRHAAEYRDQLDPAIAQRLKERLELTPMSMGDRSRAPAATMDEAAARQQAAIHQAEAQMHRDESAALELAKTDPRKALAMLEQSRRNLESSGLEPGIRDRLLRQLDRSLAQLSREVEGNKPLLDLKEKNDRVREDVQQRQQSMQTNRQKLADMINDFNRLMEEQRYEEAEIVAKRCKELDPNNPVVTQVVLQAKFAHRVAMNREIQDQKEQGVVDALVDVDRASIPFNTKEPYLFPDAKSWDKLTASRKRFADNRRRRSEREVEIEQRLKTPVSLQFENAPLSKVVEYLGKLAQINVHLDQQGLAEEGATTDTPVTIKLEHEISLKSALNLILQPLHLNYVVKDEVLKITSEQMRDGELYTEVYNVADLVIPIPNFIANPNMGIPGALKQAVADMNGSGFNPMGMSASPLSVVASAMKSGALGDRAVLAQSSSGGKPPVVPNSNGNMPSGVGPGGLGGGAQADFDALIELITSTIKPTTWDSVGGPGSIAPFETNLSIVVSQTQDVHEEIVDLLEQLRKLQDLQVTIEVRFITLEDDFFERVGVDFDFELQSNAQRPFGVFGQQIGPSVAATTTTIGQPNAQFNYANQNVSGSTSAVVGVASPGGPGTGAFSSDLNIPFTQGSYGLAVPQFGGFNAASTAGATLGFAILSDIEAYFFIQASQADTRSNLLQAPKVTLFNGQQAFVSDTTQTPFVISVIPVVGDFAAAQEPVIVVLNAGTFLTVQAVVSNDRRFVRLTVVPFFSSIGAVNTFTFTGSSTTTTSTSAEGVQTTPNDNSQSSNSSTTSSSGTTVQLPTFAFVTVTTTVSVPDGGTVLLGGIKRLSEGRQEDGVPVLDKIPYLNRLFKNVGIGRTTQSLMMMVTPRIIIQEEEEEKLGVQPQ
jgi:general secretion pathway protein D